MVDSFIKEVFNDPTGRKAPQILNIYIKQNRQIPSIYVLLDCLEWFYFGVYKIIYFPVFIKFDKKGKGVVMNAYAIHSRLFFVCQEGTRSCNLKLTTEVNPDSKGECY